METLYIIVPFALIALALVIRLLFWAINSGQYDDLDTEAARILFDDDNPNEDLKENLQLSKISNAGSSDINLSNKKLSDKEKLK